MLRAATSSMRCRVPHAARQMSTAAAEEQPAWFEGTRLAARWLVIPGGFLAGATTLGAGLQGLGMSQASEVDNGTERTTGTITQAGSNSDGSPAFKFVYKYKGEDYTSTTVVPGSDVRSFGNDKVAEWSDKYRVGTSQTVLVHPDYPHKGFLETGASADYLTNIVVGGVFTGLFYKAFTSSRALTLNQLQKVLRMAK